MQIETVMDVEDKRLNAAEVRSGNQGSAGPSSSLRKLSTGFSRPSAVRDERETSDKLLTATTFHYCNFPHRDNSV